MATFTQYKDKDNKRKWKFRGYITTDPITGKKLYTSQRNFDTKAEAQAAYDDLKREILRGKSKQKNITFEELYWEWLDHHRNSGVKPSTVATNRRFLEPHALPKLGKLKLDKITVAYCQKLVNAWYDKYKQYHYIRRAVGQVMAYGVAMEYMDSNPMRKTLLPRKKEDEKAPNFYNKKELMAFMDYVEKLDNYKYYAFFWLLAITGMRRSEALALYVSDINIFNRTLTIGKTISTDENRRNILQTPKTKSSYRTISLDDKTIRILQKWIAIQKEELLKLGHNMNDRKQFLFVNADNKVMYPQIANDWLTWIYDKAEKEGITFKRITPHGFRHTACSLMFESGASINEVQKRLGHKDVKTTMNIYSHVTPQQAENTSQKLADYLAR